MAPRLASFEQQTYALLRIVAGFLFIWHGAQKLFGFPIATHGTVAPLLTWVAGPIELIGGTLIAIGLFTRWSAFICSGQMAVAYWSFHAARGLTPLENHGELAILYCFIFLCIAATGPGLWSLDRAQGRS